MFGVMYAAEGSAPDAVNGGCTASALLLEVAGEFSPRIETFEREVLLDLSGLARLFGDAKTIAEELRRTAADRGLQIRVAIAGTRTAARLMVRHRAGITIIESGGEAAALAALPLALLGEIAAGVNSHLPTSDSQLTPTSNAQKGRKLAVESWKKLGGGNWEVGVVFARWGLRTLGDLAELPPDEVAARLGQGGVTWQCLARGEDATPLVPAVPEERFEQSLDLEWPIEELEPLAFVLGRLMEPLEAHLERRGRGAAVLHVRLSLVKRRDGAREVHERSLQLPTPIREARTLRTLALLDLESHPPPGPVERVVVAVDPTPARIVQYSLITRPLPSPEQISTLMARLQALMGETRCGSPALVDTWRPEAFEMRSFAPRDPGSGIGEPGSRDSGFASRIPDPQSRLSVALRRFRHPVPARVGVANGKPVRVTIDRRGFSGGGVAGCAGPWRTSGDWWREGWDRDEWDVALTDGATYRLFRARDTEQWFLDGVLD